MEGIQRSVDKAFDIARRRIAGHDHIAEGIDGGLDHHVGNGEHGALDAGRQADADHFLQLMSGKVFEYPVFLDIEVTPRQYKKYITDAAVVFCRELENKGYFAGIYASDISGFKDLLSIDRVAPFCKWVARYGNKPAYVKNYALWQYTSKGTIPGISGPVDIDISYKNFPKIIKGGHFNGY